MGTREEHLQRFVRRHGLRREQLLFAISGGADSMALYHAARQVLGDPLQLVHIDHGWRPESREEAERLKNWVRGDFLLESCRVSGPNLEDRARQARLAIFKNICEARGLRGVMLAHHADDQAETVLKRMSEGGRLSGMREVSRVSEVTLFRPFLQLGREELGAEPLIDDPSNRDLCFHRNRLRRRVIPLLEEELGRGVRRPLCRVADRWAEIESLLEERTAHLIVGRGALGRWIDLSGESLSRAELRHLIGREESLSWDEMQRALQLFEKGGIGQVSQTLHVDRRRLLWLEQEMDWRSWQMELGGGEARHGWERVMQGELHAFLPPGECRLAAPNMQEIGRILTANKAPSALRQRVPIVCQGEKIIFDFFTGAHSGNFSFDDCRRVTLRFAPSACQ